MKNFDIAVDRDSYIAWTKGILLQRTGNSIVIGDTLDNRAADDVLKDGGTVLLTIDGKPFSTVRLDKKTDSYVETPIKVK